MATNKKATGKSVEQFDKQQLVKSQKYLDKQDILTVLLEENKKYSFDEVDKIIEKFMKGQVK